MWEWTQFTKQKVGRVIGCQSKLGPAGDLGEIRGRERDQLRRAECIRITVRHFGLQFQLCHLLALYTWEN